jgi:hypothetical protein
MSDKYFDAFPLRVAILSIGPRTRGKAKALALLDSVANRPDARFQYHVSSSRHPEPLVFYESLLFRGLSEIQTFCQALIRYGHRTTLDW